MPAADPVTAYLARLDAALAAEPDHGYRAAHLASQIDRWNDLSARFAEWAASDTTAPNPVAPGATAFQVTRTLTGLYQRQQMMDAEARLRAVMAQSRVGAA